MSDKTTTTNAARLRTEEGQRTVREAMQKLEMATSEISIESTHFVIEYIDDVELTGGAGQERLDHLRDLVHLRQQEQDRLLHTLSGQ